MDEHEMHQFMNRMHNSRNPAQGSFPKALCVCSAGLLRSPTLAYVLSMKGYNTRAVGSVPNYALVPIDIPLIAWADEVYFVQNENYQQTRQMLGHEILALKKVYVLNIPDHFQFRDHRLIQEIEFQLASKSKFLATPEKRENGQEDTK